MLYLSPILLCISLNILLLTVTSSLKTQKISLNKSTIISISLFLTLINFILMMLVCLVIPNVIFLAIFKNKKEFKYFLDIFNKLVGNSVNQIKRKFDKTLLEN